MKRLSGLVFLLLLSPLVLAQSIAEFTNGMSKQEGLIPIYYDRAQDKVYLQVTGFDQAMIFQSSLPQGVGSNDIGLDRGQLGKTRLVEFERFGNKVLLKQLLN